MKRINEIDRRTFLTTSAAASAARFSGVGLSAGLSAAMVGCGALGEKQSLSESAVTSVKIPGPSGKSERLAAEKRLNRRVCVVGGGIAGLSAALELSERNYDVTVKESEVYLGGRLHTRQERRAGQNFAVEHGLHMWFFQYYNFQNTLERLGVWEKNFRDFKEVFFQFKPPFQSETLRSSGPYPLNMIRLLNESKNLNLLNAVGTLGAMKDVIFYDHSNVFQKFDHFTFEEWMQNANVDNTFKEVILRPAASVTLNDPSRVSAAEMLMYQHLYFMGHPKAFHRKITTTDHGTAVIDPWAEKLLGYGVSIETGTKISGLVFSGERVIGVVQNGQIELYDEVILALDVPGLQNVLQNSSAQDSQSELILKTMQQKAMSMKIAPQYSILRVWFDRPVSDSRPYSQSVVESSQYRPINLLSITSMFESESREWAERTGGSIVEFHLYNTPEFAGLSEEQIWEQIASIAFELLPELKESSARPVDFSLGRFSNFTSFEVGQGMLRPLSSYPRSIGCLNLGLAGDCIQTKFPSALMERALVTGRETANLIFAKDSVEGVGLEVPAMRGPGILPQF